MHSRPPSSLENIFQSLKPASHHLRVEQPKNSPKPSNLQPNHTLGWKSSGQPSWSSEHRQPSRDFAPPHGGKWCLVLNSKNIAVGIANFVLLISVLHASNMLKIRFDEVFCFVSFWFPLLCDLWYCCCWPLVWPCTSIMWVVRWLYLCWVIVKLLLLVLGYGPTPLLYGCEVYWLCWTLLCIIVEIIYGIAIVSPFFGCIRFSAELWSMGYGFAWGLLSLGTITCWENVGCWM